VTWLRLIRRMVAEAIYQRSSIRRESHGRFDSLCKIPIAGIARWSHGTCIVIYGDSRASGSAPLTHGTPDGFPTVRWCFFRTPTGQVYGSRIFWHLNSFEGSVLSVMWYLSGGLQLGGLPSSPHHTVITSRRVSRLLSGPGKHFP
jgi:hypothetical protein